MVASLLRGDTRDTMRYLKEKMSEASDAMRFEEAAQYKKRIEILTSYQSKSVVVSNTLTNMDVFSLVTDEDAAFCNFMRIADGGGRQLVHGRAETGTRRHAARRADLCDRDDRRAAVGQALARGNRPVPPIGKPVGNVAFTVPQRGDKLRLLELSERNAGCTGSRNSSRSRSKTPPATRTVFSRRCNGSSA